MSLQLLIREHPRRSLAVVTETHALVFRHSQSSTGVNPLKDGQKSQASRCMVEFTDVKTIDLTDYHPAHLSNVHGTLGLISMNADVFLCIISGATRVAIVRPNETVQRIHSVDFCQSSLSIHIPVSSLTDCFRLLEYR